MAPTPCAQAMCHDTASSMAKMLEGMYWPDVLSVLSYLKTTSFTIYRVDLVTGTEENRYLFWSKGPKYRVVIPVCAEHATGLAAPFWEISELDHGDSWETNELATLW